DLEGKTIAIAAGSTQFQQWPAFVKGCGLDGSQIRVANIDPAGSPPALITGQVPAIAGYALGQVPSVEIRGNTKARIFWYADCGVTAVSNCIVVHNDLIKEEPELVRAFISASLKGFLYGRKNLDEMIAIARKYSPAIEPAIARREAEMSWQSWISPNTAGKPFRLDGRKGLGGDGRGAQAVRRRYHASRRAAALYQRVRPHRRRVHPAAGRRRQEIESTAIKIRRRCNARRPPGSSCVGGLQEREREDFYFLLGTTAQASISTSISFRSIPTPLSSVAGLGCCRRSGSNSSKKRYISSRMSKTSSRRGR